MSFENLKTKFGALELSKGSEGYEFIQPWLIKRVIPQSSVGVMYGQSGSRKTFIAIDMCCSIASGTHEEETQWNEQLVKGGNVIYIAAEGQNGIKKRVKAWEIANNKKVENLYIYEKPILVSNKHEREDLIEAVKDIERKTGINVVLIVFDTLARNFVGNENSAEDMGEFIRAVDLIKFSTSSTIMVIHHSGKDASKGYRGSSALRGASDFEFQVTHNTSKNETYLKNTKQKEEAESPLFSFDFKPVELGIFCEEGEPITSLALTSPATLKESKGSTSSPMLKALTDEFGGQTTRGKLREIFAPYRDGVKSNTTNQRFKRQLDDLFDAGLINIEQIGDKAHSSDIISIKPESR